MFDRKLANKIDEFIKEKFPIIYEYDFDGLVFLFGGTARSLIMGVEIKDLDFVILTQNKCQIINFIKKYKLEYILNSFGGYKITFNNFVIDMFSTNDLIDAVRYNIDMMFYDIHRHIFISFGAIRAIEKNRIIEVNNNKLPLYCDIFRIKKLVKFLRFVNPKKKIIRIKENKLLWYFKMFLEVLKNPDKIKRFRR